MSKTSRVFIYPFLAIYLTLFLAGLLSAQDASTTVNILDDGSAGVVVNGRFEKSERPNSKNLVFLREFGEVTGLADRFSNVEATGVDGNVIALKRLIPGEYLAEVPINTWSYRVDLTPMKISSSNSHVSWLAKDQGLLMLDDLLPQAFGKAPLLASIRFVLPPGWNIFTTGTDRGDSNFEFADIENAAIFVAKEGIARRTNLSKVGIDLVVVGDWHFTDEEAAESVETIAANYQKLFGGGPTRRGQIVIARFPVDRAIGNWEGDTRGGSVTILSSDTHFKSQSVQKLSEQLRHEIFHLWMPNDVTLTGRYDWFYEGFALYQSLKVGVASKQIRFQDFLDSVSGALAMESGNRKEISLIDASAARWAGAGDRVYSRGMAVALLTDLALLGRSKGKISTGNILRSVYEAHRYPSPPQDGNTALLKIFGKYKELDEIVRRYISGSESLDWSRELLAAGLESAVPVRRGSLKVVARPNGRQKEILKRLGYNN